MKIGILTFHSADNFGCVFQCFGLQEALKEACPAADIEIINFERDFVVYEKESQYKDVEQTIRAKLFDSFRQNYLNVYGELLVNVDDLDSDRYDLCVVGSDQVWNYSLVKNFEKAYFLKFTSDKTRRISYAASLGSVVDDEERLQWLKKWIECIDSISIREKSACNVVSALTGRTVHNSIDPTLLHDSTFWEKFERRPSIDCSGRYILMYALGYNWCRESEQKAAQMATEIARKRGIKIIHYYYGKLKEWFPDEAQHCFCEGPQELLWLFHHAESVICCSFHGTAFSIIFNRPFYTFYTPGNGARMKDLVTAIGLSDRYIEEPLDDSECNWDISWDLVQNKISAIRLESMDYLKNELRAVNI